jgi:eukaryotic-like serine/threonine-protein kinase
MNLTPGTKLGPYEILDRLGAGGMGVVYRGRDPRLGREVAIKVLAPSFAADQDRLRRFEQEARAAGSLNHANILTVFDVGTHESGPYLVTELLEGETLRVRLGAGPIPVPRALDLAAQIAQGLAAAHAKGIVHRDLKPENLFLTADGRVKILDFGLAKLVRSPLGDAEVTHTMPAQASDSGSISGTAGYMSPEQVRGENVDHRSDLFALGAILQEMISGTRAFNKDSVFGTFEAIVKEDPPPISPEVATAHPGLERILHRCLEKAPDRRFQSAADLAFMLTMSATKKPSEPEGTEPQIETAPAFRRLTFRRGTVFNARFVPDGNTVVYGGSYDGRPGEIFAVQTNGQESRPLGFPSAEVLSISPSGELAVSLGHRHRSHFIWAGLLARAPMGAGAPREIEENVIQAEWGPGGDDLIVARESSGKMRIEYPLGHVLYETAGWVGNVRLSPDGTQIAFNDHPIRGDDEGTVELLSLDGKRRTLSSGWRTLWGLAWSPDGREVLFGASPFGFGRDIHAVSLTGQRRRILQAPGSFTLLDISQKGEILFTRGNERMGIRGQGAGESAERELSWLDWSLLRDMSVDGRWILFDESGEGAPVSTTVYMRRMDGAPAVRLGPGLGMEFSADRKRALTFTQPNHINILPTGAGASRTFSMGSLRCHFARWLPGEQRIIVAGNEPGGPLSAFVLDTATGSTEPFSKGVVAPEVFVGPDGQHLIHPGPDQVYASFPLDGSPSQPIPGIHPEDRPARISPDGRSMLVYQRGVIPSRLERIDLQTGKRELVRQLVPPDISGVQNIAPVRVTEDGTAYAYSFVTLLHDLYVAKGLL